MSKAKRCDRCGKFYDVYESNLHVTRTTGAYNHKALDLCPDCIKGLIKWMEKYKTEATKQ